MTLSPKYSHSAIERAYKKELESFNKYCFKYIRYWLLSAFKRDVGISDAMPINPELVILDNNGEKKSSVEVLTEKQEKARAEFNAKKELALQKATIERDNAIKALKSVGVKGINSRFKTDKLKELARQNGLDWDEIIKGEGFSIRDLTLNVGDIVEHPMLGKGEIVAIENGNYVVEINGVKRTFRAGFLKKIQKPLQEFKSDDTFEERLQKIQYNLEIKANEFVDKNIIKLQKQSESLIDTKFKNTLSVNFANIKSDPTLFKIQKMRFLENYNLIKSIPADILKSLQSTLTNAVISGDQKAILYKLKTLEGISNRRAKTIARDQTAKMLEGVNMVRQQNLGIEYYQWETSKDERVSTGKGGHKQLQGKIFRYDKPEAIIDSYGNKGHCGERVNCLAKGQGIDFRYLPNNLFRFGVASEFSKLIFTNGEFIITTREHKVLTSSGWAFVNSLNKGDKVVNLRDEYLNISEINFNHNKVIISQIFNFLDKLATSTLPNTLAFKRLGVAGYFDTDIRVNENVDIIDINSLLCYGRETFFNQIIKKLNFTSSDMRIFSNIFISSDFSFNCSPNLNRIFSFASTSFVCFFSESLDIFSTNIFKSNKVGFTARASFIAEFIQAISDNISTNTKIFRHFQNTIASNISLFQLFYIYVFFIVWGFLSRHYNSPDIKCSFDNSASGIKFFSDLRETASIDYKIVDRVENIIINSHIYSLETSFGYYTINNIINKNCRCIALGIILDIDEKIVKAPDGYGYKVVKK